MAASLHRIGPICHTEECRYWNWWMTKVRDKCSGNGKWIMCCGDLTFPHCSIGAFGKKLVIRSMNTHWNEKTVSMCDRWWRWSGVATHSSRNIATDRFRFFVFVFFCQSFVDNPHSWARPYHAKHVREFNVHLMNCAHESKSIIIENKYAVLLAEPISRRSLFIWYCFPFHFSSDIRVETMAYISIHKMDVRDDVV